MLIPTQEELNSLKKVTGQHSQDQEFDFYITVIDLLGYEVLRDALTGLISFKYLIQLLKAKERLEKKKNKTVGGTHGKRR